MRPGRFKDRFCAIIIKRKTRTDGLKKHMHELAITQNIIDIAVSQAQDRKITGINLVIGELSSVVEDSIRFCFDVISKETPAEGASIAIVRCPGGAALRILRP